jgi:hypothetical protein
LKDVRHLVREPPNRGSPPFRRRARSQGRRPGGATFAGGASRTFCYHNPPDTGEAKSGWYLSTGKSALRDGSACPSE